MHDWRHTYPSYHVYCTKFHVIRHNIIYNIKLLVSILFCSKNRKCPRALSAQALAEYLRELGAEAEAFPSVAEGVAAAIARARAHGGAVLACGSLYMVGDVVAAATKEA